MIKRGLFTFCKLRTQPINLSKMKKAILAALIMFMEDFGVSYSKQKAADEMLMLADSFEETINQQAVDF